MTKPLLCDIIILREMNTQIRTIIGGVCPLSFSSFILLTRNPFSFPDATGLGNRVNGYSGQSYFYQCTMCGVQCGMWNVQCAVCNVHCAVCGVRCAMYIAYENLYVLRFILRSYSIKPSPKAYIYHRRDKKGVLSFERGECLRNSFNGTLKDDDKA